MKRWEIKSLFVAVLVSFSLVGLCISDTFAVVEKHEEDAKIITETEITKETIELDPIRPVPVLAKITPVPVKTEESIIFEEEIENDGSGEGEATEGYVEENTYDSSGDGTSESEVGYSGSVNDFGIEVTGNEEPIYEEQSEEYVEESQQEPESNLEYIGDWTITAYCPCVECCGIWTGMTASGNPAISGHTVACNVLPMGTTVMIDGNYYVVEDTGYTPYGDAWIDIYFDTHDEALAYGMHTASVYIVR